MTTPLRLTIDHKGLSVEVRDSQVPGVSVVFTYAGDRRWPDTLVLAKVSIAASESAAQQRGEPLTVTGIRDMPLARWQTAAYSALTGDLRQKLAGTERPLFAYHRDTPRATKAMNRLLAIAYAYRLNVAAGMRDPVAAIAREYAVKPSTAASWVFRARKAGLIGPAIGRTPGEGPQSKENRT